MGYRPTPKRFRVTFEPEHELHGLELVTRSVPVDSVLAVLRAAGAGGARAATVEDIESVTKLFEHFGSALIEWNLDHPETGEPVPPTPEGLSTLDLDLVTVLSMEWVQAVLGAAAPLGPQSRRGATSPTGFPTVSIPMTPRSPDTDHPSHPSSSRPSSS